MLAIKGKRETMISRNREENEYVLLCFSRIPKRRAW